jgi:hypothetical protein
MELKLPILNVKTVKPFAIEKRTYNSIISSSLFTAMLGFYDNYYYLRFTDYAAQNLGYVYPKSRGQAKTIERDVFYSLVNDPIYTKHFQVIADKFFLPDIGFLGPIAFDGNLQEQPLMVKQAFFKGAKQFIPVEDPKRYPTKVIKIMKGMLVNVVRQFSNNNKLKRPLVKTGTMQYYALTAPNISATAKRATLKYRYGHPVPANVVAVATAMTPVELSYVADLFTVKHNELLLEAIQSKGALKHVLTSSTRPAKVKGVRSTNTFQTSYSRSMNKAQ